MQVHVVLYRIHLVSLAFASQNNFWACRIGLINMWTLNLSAAVRLLSKPNCLMLDRCLMLENITKSWLQKHKIWYIDARHYLPALKGISDFIKVVSRAEHFDLTMETPQERRILETISCRSKKDQTRMIMVLGPHHKHFQRFLYVASQAHHKELRRIERVRADARENQQVVEIVCRSGRGTTTGCCRSCSGTDSVCPPEEPPRRERVGWRCSRGGLCRTFPCEPPVSGAVQRGAGFNTAVDVSLKAYKRLRKVQFEPNEDWNDAVTIRRPTKLPMERRIEQEMRLKKNMQSHQRTRNENSSNDWFTNYGKPVSSRKILNVARP